MNSESLATTQAPAKLRWTIERAAAEPGPILHPLAGSNARTFFYHLRKHGGFTARSRKQRLVSWLAFLGRQPWSWYESVRYGRAIREHEVKKPPIFLIGHWRSGTTHLHNLLSRDPQFGYMDFGQTAMPWDMIGDKVEFGRSVIRKILPATRGYDNVRLSLEEPQEEEIALGSMNRIGYFHSYYFPQDAWAEGRRALFFDGATEQERENFERAYEFLIRKVSFAKGGKRLLFKNPPSTVRIPLLKRLYPHAKFVHIVRNPYPVYRSSIGKFPRLFNAFAWQDFSDVDTHRITIDTYADLMKQYLVDRQTLSDQDLYETSYEKITADPLGEIGRIYDRFEIEDKDAGLASIGQYVESIRDYEPNVHRMSRAHVEEIQDRWAFSFEHWGYPIEPPEGIRIED
ncbi:MAG: sulfotransferase [Verrucomicrobiae bacterium]|nr:sulfotransferase [Verrucomicrobiae bacterium]